MFTGIIEKIGLISRCEQGLLEIQADFPDLSVGESIAVNGVCLTATTSNASGFSCDLSPETLQRTTLGSLQAGSRVNLERAMKAEGRFGGHLVQGHVETTTKISSVTPLADSHIFQFALPANLAKYIVAKGSIAIDGTSLTVVETTAKLFSVAVIPYTFNHTTLGQKKPGDSVNLEPDIVAKYLDRLLQMRRPWEALEEGKETPPDELYVKKILPWEALEEGKE